MERVSRNSTLGSIKLLAAVIAGSILAAALVVALGLSAINREYPEGHLGFSFDGDYAYIRSQKLPARIFKVNLKSGTREASQTILRFQRYRKDKQEEIDFAWHDHDYQGRYNRPQGYRSLKSPNGKWLALASTTQEVFVLRAKVNLEQAFRVEAGPTYWEWSSDSDSLLLRFPTKGPSKLRVYDLTGALLWSGRGQQAWWGPEPGQVRVLNPAGKDGVVDIVELNSGKVLESFPMPAGGGWSWQPGGTRLLYWANQGTYLWDNSKPEPKKLIRSGRAEWNADGQSFVVDNYQGVVDYYDKTGELLYSNSGS